MRPTHSVIPRPAWLFGLVLVLAGLAYGPALDGPLFFDDLPSLTRNPMVQISGSGFDQWRTAAYSSDAGPLHRPLAMLSFAANYAVAGSPDAFAFKLVNLAIHLVTGALVYAFSAAVFCTPALAGWGRRRAHWAAFLAASIWVLHPLNVSTVLYAVQRMAQLATLFVLLGLWVYLRYRLAWAARGATAGEVVAALMWLVLLTGAATLAKENGALLPWLVACVEVGLLQGQWRGRRSTVVARAGWAALVFPLVLLLLILLLSPDIFTSGYQLRDFTLAERLLTQARVLWHYVSWLLVPDLSAMGFHHDDIPLSRGLLQPWTTLLSLAGWLVALLGAFRLRHRFPLALFALLFFLVGQVMESSVLALEMVFEHRNYLPAIGLSILLAGALVQLAGHNRPAAGWLVFAGVPVILLALLFLRAQVWSDARSLAYANVVNHPMSARAHYFYADTLMAKYRDDYALPQAGGPAAEVERKNLVVAARVHFMKMYELAPDSATSIVNLLYLDSYFFPAIPEPTDWFRILRQTLSRRVLQASDLAALSLLTDCVANGGCEVGVAQVEALLDELISRNPGEVWLLLSRYQLLAATGGTPGDRIALLDRAAQVSRNNPSVQQFRVVERANLGDIGGTYEVVRSWLAHDPGRRSLPAMLPLFSAGREGVPQGAVGGADVD